MDDHVIDNVGSPIAGLLLLRPALLLVGLDNAFGGRDVHSTGFSCLKWVNLGVLGGVMVPL